MSAEITKIYEPTYFGFTPIKYKDYFIGLEKIEEMYNELKKLHAEHYEETETLYKERPMEPDYASYIQLEHEGKFVLFTVRDIETGRLVGDLMYYLGASVHNKGVMMAREDAFFISKEYRGGRLALKFLKFAETCLLELGVGQIGMTDKSPCGGKSLSKLLEPLGYKPVALQYVKEIGLEDKEDVL